MPNEGFLGLAALAPALRVHAGIQGSRFGASGV